jgi:hypothetical protein
MKTLMQTAALLALPLYIRPNICISGGSDNLVILGLLALRGKVPERFEAVETTEVVDVHTFSLQKGVDR